MMTFCDSAQPGPNQHAHRCGWSPGHGGHHTCHACGTTWALSWEQHMEVQHDAAVHAAQNRATLTAIALHAGMVGLAQRHAAEHHRWAMVAKAISDIIAIEQETNR